MSVDEIVRNILDIWGHQAESQLSECLEEKERDYECCGNTFRRQKGGLGWAPSDQAQGRSEKIYQVVQNSVGVE
jgi:hypothetical protein